MFNKNFWEHLHGGATHFPIALVMVSVLFDWIAFFWREETRRRELRAVGFYSLVIGALGSFGAVVSGLFLTKGELLGGGMVGKHHLFVWPAFGLLLVVAIWRLLMRNAGSRGVELAYLILASIMAATVSAAGYYGGEMLLGEPG